MERQQAQQAAFALGPAGVMPPSTEATVAWKFTADDNWSLALEPGSAALVVDGDHYQGIEDFAQRFSQVLAALQKTQRVRRCDRIGVRYVNVIEPLPGVPRTWERWFKPEVVGWIGASVLGGNTRLQVSSMQTQLATSPIEQFAGAPADVQAIIRNGVFPSGTEIPLDIGLSPRLGQESYVIDLDMFIQAPQPFVNAVLLEQFRALHAQIDAFFRWSLSEQGESHFGVEEL